jgi:hypothetical protein
VTDFHGDEGEKTKIADSKKLSFSKPPILYTFWPKNHCYTTLEDVFGVQRSRQIQETIIFLFGSLFFSQNGMNFKKPTKVFKNH